MLDDCPTYVSPAAIGHCLNAMYLVKVLLFMRHYLCRSKRKSFPFPWLSWTPMVLLLLQVPNDPASTCKEHIVSFLILLCM
jgi:hypothetical protein